MELRDLSPAASVLAALGLGVEVEDRKLSHNSSRTVCGYLISRPGVFSFLSALLRFSQLPKLTHGGRAILGA